MYISPETYFVDSIRDYYNLSNKELKSAYERLWEAGANMHQEGDAIEPETWSDWDKAWDIVTNEMAGRFSFLIDTKKA